MYLAKDTFQKEVSRRLNRLLGLLVHTKLFSRDWLKKVYHLLVKNNYARGRGLINFLPLKREGWAYLRQGAHLRGDLNREFRVIKQKHRAGQFRHHNSLRFWISGTVLQIPCQRSMYFGLQSLLTFQIPWVGFWIPKENVFWISDSTSKSFPDSGNYLTEAIIKHKLK